MARRILTRRHTVKALFHFRKVLHPNRRHWHAGRLVPSHSSNSGRLDLEDVDWKEAWCANHIHDRKPVSFDIPSNGIALSWTLTFHQFKRRDFFYCESELPRPAAKRPQRSNMEGRLRCTLGVRQDFLPLPPNSVGELMTTQTNRDVRRRRCLKHAYCSPIFHSAEFLACLPIVGFEIHRHALAK